MRASAAATIVAVALAVASAAAASGIEGRRSRAGGAVDTAETARAGERLHAAPAERRPADSLPVWLVPVAAGALLVAAVLARRSRAYRPNLATGGGGGVTCSVTPSDGRLAAPKGTASS